MIKNQDLILTVKLIKQNMQTLKCKITIAKKCMKNGLQQGIKAGIQSVAKKLLEKDIPIEIIKSTTGLTDEEISKLM